MEEVFIFTDHKMLYKEVGYEICAQRELSKITDKKSVCIIKKYLHEASKSKEIISLIFFHLPLAELCTKMLHSQFQYSQVLSVNNPC